MDVLERVADVIPRRSFLAGILSAAVAPAYVKAGILMPVKQVWTPGVDVTYSLEGLGLPRWKASENYGSFIVDEDFYKTISERQYRYLFRSLQETREELMANLYRGQKW